MLLCHNVKLFNLMILCYYVPDWIRYRYIVRIPKPKKCYSKPLTLVPISEQLQISPILYEVFEHCIFKRYETFFLSSDNRFIVGFNY